MNLIQRADAHRIAVEFINLDGLGDVTIVDNAVVEADDAWYFPYDGTDYLVNGNISAALAGNLPIKVLKDGTLVGYERPPGW
ncbi:hypothetical protein [Mycobacteroides salmoniphilum]|uniref:hypothetical protein n=1 Tax=Mycobacteroides salmoniphilum TaxID=404941 RepID=UPI000992C548|nr:hypothetical protein [Mycobacteroides salmoniphilum]